MKTKLTILINSVAFVLIGAGVNAYSAEPSSYGMDHNQSMSRTTDIPTMDSNPSSRSMKGNTPNINEDIQTVNTEIKQVAQNFDANYDKAMQAAQSVSGSRAVQGSFMDRIDALKARFYNVLNDYKPANQNWESFNAGEYHNINMNDRNDMIRFAQYADGKLIQLEKINEQLVDLKWQIEGKDGYQGATYSTYPYYGYSYYDNYYYYPSTYYSFPFSFGLGFN